VALAPISKGSPEPNASDRRLYPRESVSDAVRIVTAAGAVFDATVVDRSLRGMRIECAEGASLPSDVTILSLSAGAAYVARVVWRTPPYAGLSILRTVDMRTATGSESERFHKLWREHLRR
jgi:hypothetical protein